MLGADYMSRAGSVARDDCSAWLAMLGSQLAGLRFFHVIAKLIFSVFHRRAEIPAKRASLPYETDDVHAVLL